MSEDVNAMVDDITERVRRRLQALKVGTEQPCTASPAKSSSVPLPVAEGSGACSTGCGSCGNGDSCGTSFALRQGVARISPDRIRTSNDIAPFIDHTLLKPDATREEILKLCEEAARHGFATVCVNAVNVAIAARALHGTAVLPIAVVGFPLGATTPSAKSFETREAVRCGAKEIDMVINIGALKSKDYELVQRDIAAVVQAARPAPVKVILETSQLDQEQKIIACALSKAAGAAFVKTSTGFSGGGATVEDITLMRRIVGDDMGVKASGGVRSQDDAMKFIAAGANRLGASASVAIVTGQKSNAKY